MGTRTVAQCDQSQQITTQAAKLPDDGAVKLDGVNQMRSCTATFKITRHCCMCSYQSTPYVSNCRSFWQM
jgi:hypothetical protein